MREKREKRKEEYKERMRRRDEDKGEATRRIFNEKEREGGRMREQEGRGKTG